MKFTSIKFKGYRCFQDEWAGFDDVKPITVIIGRNNVGKSHLLHLVKTSCEERIIPPVNGAKYQIGWTLDEMMLRPIFPDKLDRRFMYNHWSRFGRLLVGNHIFASVINTGHGITYKIDDLSFLDALSNQYPQLINEQATKITHLFNNGSHTFAAFNFRHLLADRDIKAELPTTDLILSSDGAGATNIIRRFIHTTHEDYPRDRIQVEMLRALNHIFAEDGCFTEIQCNVHDAPQDGQSHLLDHWEIFLGEAQKNLISLSNSGSGLKTVFLVLLNLLVIPHIEKKPKHMYVYAFEELENNLHPALLRRMFRYLEEYAVENNVHIFLTTHSSTALDLFGSSPNAQIVSVTHDGKSAHARTISAHFDQLSVIAELGAKPSDLLQANGIIWVEGPSDRVYLNKWIELFSGGKWREGRDYQCAFYGGALLARLGVADPKAEEEFVNLLQINPNLLLVCDGDRTAAKGKGSGLKKRVSTIKQQVESLPNSHIWITKAKEIENYLPGELLADYIQSGQPKDPGQYERFFPTKKSEKGSSYLESQLGLKSIDKMELALETAPKMTKEMMRARFDLEKQITAIIEKIEQWNHEGAE